jgi:hypothetical protein
MSPTEGAVREMSLWPAVARVTLAILLLSAATGCHTPVAPVDVLPDGRWGGDHAELVVGESSATIEFDCAHGTLSVPIPIDADGRFDVPGTFTREQGGPIREDDPPAPLPARYAGTTDGRRTTLTVRLVDAPHVPIGTYELVLGRPGRLFKCA